GLSLLGLVLLFIIPFQYYDQLSDLTPAHFGSNGKPDAWSGKNSIWFLPCLGLLAYIILTIVNRIPEKLNYAVKITEENMERQYQNAIKLCRHLKLLILGFLAYFMHGKIQVALGNVAGLNPTLLFAFVGGILLLVGFYIWRSFQLEK
ncbi:MAG: putative membrane protein, partial [Gammaproteobacteria bacterium]